MQKNVDILGLRTKKQYISGTQAHDCVINHYKIYNKLLLLKEEILISYLKLKAFFHTALSIIKNTIVDQLFHAGNTFFTVLHFCLLCFGTQFEQMWDNISDLAREGHSMSNKKMNKIKTKHKIHDISTHE